MTEDSGFPALRERVLSAQTPEEALGLPKGASRQKISEALRKAKLVLGDARRTGGFPREEVDEVEMYLNKAFQALIDGREWVPARAQGAEGGQAEAYNVGQAGAGPQWAEGQQQQEGYWQPQYDQQSWQQPYGQDYSQQYSSQGGQYGDGYGNQQYAQGGRGRPEGQQWGNGYGRRPWEKVRKRGRVNTGVDWGLGSTIAGLIFVPFFLPIFYVFDSEKLKWLKLFYIISAFGVLMSIFSFIAFADSYYGSIPVLNEFGIASFIKWVVGNTYFDLAGMASVINLPPTTLITMLNLIERHKRLQATVVRKVLCGLIPTLVGVLDFFLYGSILINITQTGLGEFMFFYTGLSGIACAFLTVLGWAV